MNQQRMIRADSGITSAHIMIAASILITAKIMPPKLDSAIDSYNCKIMLSMTHDYMKCASK